VNIHRIAQRFLAVLAALLMLGPGAGAQAERIKDLVSIQGVRANQLVGYGIVVGLDNSGDQTTQTPFTVQGVINMLSQLGINLPVDKLSTIQLKNVAAVMVTGALPAFSSPGQSIDVVVSSLGNAKSLRGGTLLMTPLKGADGEVYAMAQGNVVVSGAGAAASGSKVQINHLSAGRIPGGGTVERAVPSVIAQGGVIQLELNTTDFSTVSRVVDAINAQVNPGTAVAVDGRVIRVAAPEDPTTRVAFIGRIESIEVAPAQTMAKVIVNSRTGSIVMNQSVKVETCAVAHGNLSVVVSTEPVISQPAPLGQGETVVVPRSQIEITQQPGSLLLLQRSISLGDVVKALNAVGATPLDLIAILQAMKAAGALRADLEII
jgi:flagellar P-ring protein FlgI